ncbi:hypothetical protein BH11MYX4_BH11MYX4_28370 [soil metagenome]
MIFIADAGGSTRTAALDAGPPAEPPPAPRPPPPLEFGPGSVRPGDAHPFRLAVALRAMRGSPSGVKIASLLSLLDLVAEAKTKTGVDPFVSGEWLLVYGPRAEVPGPNANVLRHGKPEAEIARAVAAAGFEARDGGGGGGGVQASLYGVREPLLRPQPGLLALVPADRAADLSAALAQPVDPGVKAGELARLFLAEPAKVLRIVPDEVVRANAIAKPAADGGLDLSADADCGDAARCSDAATRLGDFVARQNSMMVRMLTRSLFSGLAFKANGARLEATLHASPDQVEAILSLLRAQLGLPPPPPAARP